MILILFGLTFQMNSPILPILVQCVKKKEKIILRSFEFKGIGF